MLRCLVILLLVGLIGVTCQCSELTGQETPVLDASAINSPQVVVLKNGSILQGRVENHPLNITLETNSGSKIVIRRERISFVSESLAQAYWGKLARLSSTDIDGHVALFHWCLKHKLLTEAGNQIDVLALMDIKAGHLSRLSELLASATRSPKVGVAPSKPETRTVSKTKIKGWSSPLVAVPTRDRLTANSPNMQTNNAQPNNLQSKFDSSVQKASYLEAPAISRKAEIGNGSDPKRMIPSLSNKSSRSYVPIDRFDPEIFNRLQSGKRGSARQLE